MTGFIQRAPTRTNVLPAGVTIEQKPQAHPGKGTSVDTKPTWVASQGPRWKVAHTKTPGSPPPLAAQKHRLQANTAAKKSPTPPTAKPLPERSAVPQPAQKVKFEALCEAAHEKYSLKNKIFKNLDFNNHEQKIVKK